jgi:hypothetical protein
MMKQSGLQVVPLDAKAAAQFRSLSENLTATQRGALIPSDIYDLALRAREAFRKAKSAQ